MALSMNSHELKTVVGYNLSVSLYRVLVYKVAMQICR